MGKELNSPSSQRSSSAQHDTHDAVYDAQELSGGAPGVTALDPNSSEYKELERRLVRKIDIRLMPITILLYILNYLDRNSISTARDNGLERDLGLKGQEYPTALSILYVGYITFQIPSNLFMTKLGRPSLYIPTFVTLWGVVSACTAATTGYHSLLAVRIILGAVESAFFPAALAMLSFFYRKNEMATRTALLFSGSIISNAFSGLISAGILSRMEGKAGLPAWKWLFIIEGAITVVVAAMAVFILPDMPENSKFLSVEERQMAVNRLKLDVGTSLSPGEDEGTPMQGLIMAVKDVKVWVLAFMLTSVTVGVGFNQFFPTIVGSLGYSHTVTLLLTAPIWLFAFFACLANGLHSDRVQERTLHIIIPLLFGIVGFIISSTTTSLGARFFALFIEASSYAGYTCVLGWIAPSIPTPRYKKAVALALINAFSQLGNISASYVWLKKWGPKYWQSNTISSAMFVACIALVLLHRTMLKRENAQLDKIKQEQLVNTAGSEDAKFGSEAGDDAKVVRDPESHIATDAASKKQQTRIAMAKSSFRYML
ncbi:MFS general substrate transporter [Moesziomyces antarcticus]|uniref:Related to TNA1 - high affinity nicotinic acid plasma membrane permease n=1 Tax=Pseudozyma antarctica TaxID=84753 RepID=A0A5C3FHW4_PSEA2|nr:MFS general substrate transporter [Moesziomyces antarcticus]GAK63386.1 MFS general substrate transporter [Moesziomyces antarcticus]SPO43968.1 related to TNA1 - high affinity nicotinic acid plasma membrane permease [Moesziomyces antarcticus]